MRVTDHEHPIDPERVTHACSGLPSARKQGRVVDNWLAADFPAALRDYCLRQLIAPTHNATNDATSKSDSRHGVVG